MKHNSIILGLGTNVGDRLGNLIKGISFIRDRLLNDLTVSCLYQSEALLLPGSPQDWNLPYLNIAVSGTPKHETSALEILVQVKAIEADVGRIQRGSWAPRELDIDILAWGQFLAVSEMLTIPHRALHERPFALWPLADIEPLWNFPVGHELGGRSAQKVAKNFGNRFYKQAWHSVFCGTQRADADLTGQFNSALKDLDLITSDGTTFGAEFVGILNITPDSFSDGGQFSDHQKALDQINKLSGDGALVIDIGAESSKPGALALSAQEEWTRLEPLLLLLQQEFSGKANKPLFSLDTYHPETAEKALVFGMDWINDVTGGKNPDMLSVLRQAECKYVAMHSLTVPVDKSVSLPTSVDPMATLVQWANDTLQKLELSGISRDRVILDPGIGFGKTPEQCLEILWRISELTAIHDSILLGHSRKSFMNFFGAKTMEERDVTTATIGLHLAQQGVRFLRVHDVASCRALLRAAATLT